MKIYIPLLIISIVWLTTSCQKETLPVNAPEELQLQVMMAGEQPGTRVAVDEPKFDPDDEFRFFFNESMPTADAAGTNTGQGVDDNYIKVADYTYTNSNKWTTTTPIYWDDQKTITNRKFCGIMPFSSNYTVASHSFTVATDQSVKTGYQASDLMIARTITAKRLIPLNFWHALSRVVVNVTVHTTKDIDVDPDHFAENALEGMTVDIYNVYPIATIDYSTNPDTDSAIKDPKIAVAADNTSMRKNVTMYHYPLTDKIESNKVTSSHIAIIPPQTITKEDGTTALVITLTDGPTEKKYYFKHTDNITFEQHKKTVINVTLSKLKVEGTITVEPWGTIEADGSGPIVLP